MITLLSSHDTRLALLLRTLARGERLAQRSAARQAQLVPLSTLRRRLGAQARQEKIHAMTFAAAARLFDGRERAATTPLDRAFEAFAGQLDGDLAGGRLAASFVGLQGVLEGLGEALMMELDAAADPRTARFDALRRRFMQQERGHQALGARCLRVLDEGAAVRAASHCYRDLGEQLVRAGATVFCDSAQAEARFLAHTRREMELWLASELA